MDSPTPTRSESRPSPCWTEVGPAPELEPGALRTFKHGRHQLVVGRTATGDLLALDNRCPHEGYPLAQGDLKGDCLTCCWHNWKFDVRDGSCFLGGEAVRSFPIRERAGTVEVDLADPDPSALVPPLLDSLYEGMRRHENGRAIRDGVRLLEAGFPAWQLLAEIAAYDARHAEYGCTHALAVAADCGRVLPRYRGAEAMFAIAPALDLCAETNQRMPARERPTPIPGGSVESLRAAVEAEDAERAEGLLLGAIESGVDRATIESWLFTVVSDHFLDFGHPLIYLVKAQELLAHVDTSYAGVVYPALLYGVVLGTREDTLPYLDAYSRRFAAIEHELPELAALGRTDADLDEDAFRAAVLDGSPEQAFAALEGALRDGVPARRIAENLVIAASHRLYRFDVSHDTNAGVAEGWLWCTHRVTFASAVRNAVTRFDVPDALRFLFQCLAFLHSGKGMDGPVETHCLPNAEESSASGVLAAIGARDAQLAVARCRSLLDDEAAVDELRVLMEDLCLGDPLVRPIVVGHAIKNTWAAFEEYAALAGHTERGMPLLATVRFLASPVAERSVHATVQRSIAWVARGEMPRKLTQ